MKGRVIGAARTIRHEEMIGQADNIGNNSG
jgi:hypothetical protein